MNSLDELSRALGRFAAGGDGSEGAGGAPPIMPQVLPPGAVPGDVALGQIQDMYRVLQAEAARIDRIYGAMIPCDIQTHHNDAVKAYQTAAQSVFDQILAQNPQYKIVQYQYNADGSLMATIQKNRPLIPAVYIIPGCKDNAPQFAGSVMLGNLGLAPLAWIVIAVIAGATAVALSSVVIKSWPTSAVDAARAQAIWVTTKLDCVDRQIKDKNLSKLDAIALCKGITGDAPQSNEGGLTLSGFFLILGLGTVGGYLLFKALKGGSDSYGPSDSIAGFAGSGYRRRKRRCLCS